MEKVIIVTGSGSGFGKLTAKTLAKKGEKVYASMRNITTKNKKNAQELTNWASDNSCKLEVIELDVTDSKSVHRAIDQILEKEGVIDVVINNAGGGGMGVLESYNDEQFKKTFDVNLFGVINVTKAVIPSMREHKKGLIINVSSAVGRFGFPLMAPYVSSKWAVEGLTQSLFAELAPVGIDAVIIEPGAFPTTDFFGKMDAYSPTNTEIIKEYGDLANMPQQFSSMMEGMVTAGEAPSPQAVADAVVELINLPAGKRPLRTVVDFMLGREISKYNEVTDDLQKLAFESFTPHEEVH